VSDPRTALVGAGYDAMIDLGAPTFFSSFPPETNTRLLAEAGFTLLRDELVTISEPEGPATFQWVLARR
jgi:hypothetical protein